MADNVPITAGTGTNIASDELTIGAQTAQVQFVKILDATADSTNRLVIDSSGRVSVNTRVGALTLTTGTITTSSSAVTATTDVSAAGSATVVIAGTYAGVNATFEGSLDGSTWISVIGQRTDAYQTEVTTGVLVANTTRAWDFPLPGFTQFRVRATAYTSGTANVGIMPAVNPFEPAPTVGLAGTPTAPTLSNVTVSASSFTVLAANQSRRNAAIFNDGTAITYLNLAGATASTTAYTIQVAAGGYYELPGPCYTGLITAIGSSATGTLRVTEIT